MTGPDAASAQRGRRRPDSAGLPGAVIVTHGGRSVSIEPTAALQPTVLRMIPVAGAIRHALRGTGTRICRPRFRVRGWNGPELSPVQDLTELLDRISRDWGHIPVVLVGHSMGARAALRAAGHPLVFAVAGLAPWLPPAEPVGQLAGRRILLVHATADEVTSPAQTWAYAERARSVTEVATIEIRAAIMPCCAGPGCGTGSRLSSPGCLSPSPTGPEWWRLPSPGPPRASPARCSDRAPPAALTGPRPLL